MHEKPRTGPEKGVRGSYDHTPIVKSNARLESYYKAQGIIPDDEWDAFMDTIKKPLPTTFRLAGFQNIRSKVRVRACVRVRVCICACVCASMHHGAFHG